MATVNQPKYEACIPHHNVLKRKTITHIGASNTPYKSDDSTISHAHSSTLPYQGRLRGPQMPPVCSCAYNCRRLPSSVVQSWRISKTSPDFSRIPTTSGHFTCFSRIRQEKKTRRGLGWRTRGEKHEVCDQSVGLELSECLPLPYDSVCSHVLCMFLPRFRGFSDDRSCFFDAVSVREFVPPFLSFCLTHYRLMFQIPRLNFRLPEEYADRGKSECTCLLIGQLKPGRWNLK